MTASLKDIRVCKEFYLSTLDISSRRVQWFFEQSDKSFNDRRGKHTKKKISLEAKNIIRDHIKSFPKMPSHYCRSKTKREYLEPNLSINKMYELYKELCSSLKIIPEKNHLYRNIFNTEFNLGFHIPKKDKCDICEEHKASKSNDVTGLDEKYQNYIKDKLETKIERDKDRGIIHMFCVLILKM